MVNIPNHQETKLTITNRKKELNEELSKSRNKKALYQTIILTVGAFSALTLNSFIVLLLTMPISFIPLCYHYTKNKRKIEELKDLDAWAIAITQREEREQLKIAEILEKINNLSKQELEHLKDTISSGNLPKLAQEIIDYGCASLLYKEADSFSESFVPFSFDNKSNMSKEEIDDICFELDDDSYRSQRKNISNKKRILRMFEK